MVIKPSTVIDAHGNYEENIERIVKLLGRSKARTAVFIAVYKGGQKPKSVDKIEEIIENKHSRQEIINEVNYLKNHKLITADKDKKNKNVYGKIDFIKANRDKILRYASSPDKLSLIDTKRRPTNPQAKITPKANNKIIPSSKNNNKKAQQGKKIRIAFLATNPIKESSLRTDIELRDITKKLQKTRNRDNVDLKPVLAAEVVDTLDVLNEFFPNIVHFSGHGRKETLVFDNKSALEDGGVDIDFALVTQIISATKAPPTMLVLNACETFAGADRFLEHVPVVVAMSSSIEDSAAIFFAVQFYAAIVEGQPINAALKQGQIVLATANIRDADLPRLICREEIDPNEFKFI